MWSLKREVEMHRFFVELQQIINNKIHIIGDDYKHIAKVLRLRIGDTIEVCNGLGMDYLVVLEQLCDDEIIGSITKKYPSLGENKSMEVTLFQGLPKGTKMEVIIQKSVELGVVKIIPFNSKRTISKINNKKDKKIPRWQRIAYEAAKQSKRGIIPEVKEPLVLGEMIDQVRDYDLMILAYEEEEEHTLKNVLKDYERKENLTIGILIGPEGGFDSEEVALCQKAGMLCVSLGKRILRTETAGMVVLSQLNFWKESET